jgi:prepilin-type N-terminal cleavage/methylation domain-containing protein
MKQRFLMGCQRCFCFGAPTAFLAGNLPLKVKVKAFTLLELMVAITILTMMMAFMFSVVGQAIATWEIGNRRIEAAQAARIGLNSIAMDLQYAHAGNITVIGPGLNSRATNIIPFFATNNATSTAGTSGTIVPIEGGDQIFAIVSHGDLSERNPFRETGYLCVFTGSAGSQWIAAQSYALIKHSPAAADADFYLRGSPRTNWISSSSWGAQRIPIIENCIRFDLSYATTDSSSNMVFTNAWTNQTSLPHGVLVEVTVLDSKTMSRLRRLKEGAAPLNPQELSSITNVSVAPSTPVERLLREGSVTMRRFIPFLNNQPSP